MTASDVVTKPLSDFNIKKDELPEVLVAARQKPYALSGLKKCPAIAAEVAKLDAVLGDDIDVARDDGNSTISMGNIAKSLVGSLIPFGGVIREISGANAQQRKWNEAIYAGSVRRAYLKGVANSADASTPPAPPRRRMSPRSGPLVTLPKPKATPRKRPRTRRTARTSQQRPNRPASKASRSSSARRKG